jgi:hypothetical protein
MIGATSHLISDGWLNVNNDAIINYMAASPEFAMFWSQYRQANKGTITSLLPTTSSASFAKIHPQYLLVQ